MNKNQLIVILLIASLIAFGITSLIYSFYGSKVETVREVNMSLTVGDKVGFDLSNESLTFGMVTKGGTSSSRHVEVGNAKNYPLQVNVVSEGKVGEWVEVNPRTTLLEQNETKRIYFVAEVPENASFGNYTGKAIFIYERI